MPSIVTALYNLVGITLLSFLIGNDVALNVNVPKAVNAGSEFDVEVILKKGNLSGFARLQQDLPMGLTAQLVESSLGDFSFDEQKLRFVWLRLPEGKEMRLVYRVKVDERLKGSFTLKGTFAYVDNNERKTAEFQTSTISINPSTRIDPNLIVDINEFQTIIPPQAPVGFVASNVRCIRQTPIPSGAENDYLVKLLVNKGNAQKFAKIEEDVPEGFTAEAIETKDAVFTFKDQKVKFLWMNLPAEPRFVVSYKLIAPDGKGNITVSLKGTFSYLVGEATRVIDIIQKDIDLTNIDPAALDGLISSTFSTEGANIISGFTPYSEGGIDIPIEYKKIEDKPKRKAKPEFDMEPFMLMPEKGVYYRVQIAAGHKPIDIKRYFTRYNIKYDVRTEKHEGWYKYSIGSFKEYKEARDFRILIWNSTRINDAFVTAYNNGTRITVQEALMITSQKWYR
ncbi:MAG: SPOR domain-containing protein [Tenuifilum sp.]|uniref:SPOR domain-containing protein n=1 Tax=Tenuifilum sp. TaxID=2760880 RepID=UPI001B5E7B89|nr:SPOR domain-containing protein [Bacteroidales bacterium]HOU75432.1 SPOR domain-containing protein [Tenuifilum sp.]HQE55648.1 SPOR domain-containing protein [Tenuifilum sp.]HQG73616.1 SPOR domain-containing protein [Tenuifilum sp.]HQI88877.1 SPOR domain-containing protein [Tenuifilum sp.]